MKNESGWIYTVTRKRFDLLNPRPEDVCIEDIAVGLSNICRFGGQVRQTYSVAQHSVHVCHRVEELVLGDEVGPTQDLLDEVLRVKRWALLHDAAEAYLGDVVRPLKRVPGMLAYREMEARVEVAVAQRFGLVGEMPPDVKLADEQLLATESRDLFAEGEWRDIKRPGVRCEPLSRLRVIRWKPEAALYLFFAEFRKLWPDWEE